MVTCNKNLTVMQRGRAMSENVDYTLRELLIEMRGDMALIRRDNQQTQNDVREARAHAQELSQTVAAIVARNHREDGDKQGFNRAVKAVYGLATVCGLGGIAAAAKILFPAIGAQ